MELGPGTAVTSNVRLVRELGRGGMGSVWAADHLTLEMQVAVKFIAKEVGGENETARKRFEREAKAAAKIKSPHVVQMFDHGLLEDGTPYIVMELLEGESLEHRLALCGAMQPHEVAKIVRQVAKALGSAHRVGIVHRDIKPPNVFLTQADEELHVKVLDFGIAKPIAAMAGESAVTRTGAMMGTPAYMSPEQMSDTKRVGPASDLWSLAVVAYQALTGRVPFAGDTLVSLWQAMCDANYEPASVVVGSLPAQLDGWFGRAFQVEPADRFASANELASAFEDAVAGLPSEQRSHRELAVAPTALAGTLDPAAADTATTEFVREEALGVGVEPAGAPEARGKMKPAVPAHAAGVGQPVTAPQAAPAKPATATYVMIAVGAIAVGVLIYWQLSTPPPSRADRTVALVASDASRGKAQPSASTSAQTSDERDEPVRPLRARCKEQRDCPAERIAWCDPEQRVIACCAPWLVATGRDGMCTCPPGGTDKVEAAKAGCEVRKAPPADEGRDAIRTAVRDRLPRLRRCYEDALERNVKLTARVAVGFEITPDGDVFGARIADTTVGDTAFQQCILAEFRELRFPPPFKGGADVIYPVEFSPQP